MSLAKHLQAKTYQQMVRRPHPKDDACLVVRVGKTLSL